MDKYLQSRTPISQRLVGDCRRDSETPIPQASDTSSSPSPSCIQAKGQPQLPTELIIECVKEYLKAEEKLEVEPGKISESAKADYDDFRQKMQTISLVSRQFYDIGYRLENHLSLFPPQRVANFSQDKVTRFKECTKVIIPFECSVLDWDPLKDASKQLPSLQQIHVSVTEDQYSAQTVGYRHQLFVAYEIVAHKACLGRSDAADCDEKTRSNGGSWFNSSVRTENTRKQREQTKEMYTQHEDWSLKHLAMTLDYFPKSIEMSYIHKTSVSDNGSRRNEMRLGNYKTIVDLQKFTTEGALAVQSHENFHNHDLWHRDCEWLLPTSRIWGCVSFGHTFTCELKGITAKQVSFLVPYIIKSTCQTPCWVDSQIWLAQDLEQEMDGDTDYSFGFVHKESIPELTSIPSKHLHYVEDLGDNSKREECPGLESCSFRDLVTFQ